MADAPKWVELLLKNQEEAMSIMRQQLAQTKAEAKEAQEMAKQCLEESSKNMQTLIEKMTFSKDSTGTGSMAHEHDGYALLMRDLPQYSHDPEDESTVFKAWYERHGDEIESLGAKLSEEDKRNIIVRKLDGRAFKAYSDSILPMHPRDISLGETIKKLEQLFGSCKTLLRRRLEFFNLQCQPLTSCTVPFTDYMNAIKRTGDNAKVKDIDSNTLQSLMFILGLKDSSLCGIRESLVKKVNNLKDTDEVPKIEDLTEEANRMAASRVDSNSIGEKPKIVQYVHSDRQGKHESGWRSWTRTRSPTSRQNVRFDRSPSPKHDQNKRRNPPHKTFKQRSNPKPTGNWTNRGRSMDRNQKSVSAVKQEESAKAHKTIALVEMHGRQLKLQVDCGSEITIVSKKNWQRIGSPHYANTAATVKAVNGSAVRIYGTFETNFKVKSQENKWIEGRGTAYVSDDIDILGIDWCMQLPEYKQLHQTYHVRQMDKQDLSTLRFHTLSELQQKFPEVFEPGLGKCTKAKAVLQLIPSATPVFRNKRPVPYAYLEAVDKELDRLCNEQVLSRIDHSNWAAPIVVVKKTNGKVRICADFSTGLNDALMLHQHPLPTVEDVFNKLSGGQLYSQIDLADAYLQVEMDAKSRELMTINTHRGLYRYNRLPFGVKSAPGIFQQVMDKLTVGLEGVVAYLDDIIITGRNTQEHRHNLFALFSRIKDYGLRVRIDKCNFMRLELKFLGHIVSSAGRRMDPEKVKAISKMPEPQNKTELKSFLGMITYYGAYVPEMRRYRGPLDELLKQDNDFVWSSDCQKAFDSLKQVLTSDLLLMHYDPKLPIIVAADASQYGIGAVLLQRLPDGSQKAVCHASKSLTAAEKRYGQIEKEGLALVFAVRKFHRYLYGRRFSLWTDHKPLLAIFGSKHGLPATSVSRLIRWALILKAYDFIIEYKRTTEFGQADALSRLIADTTASEEDVIIAQTKLEAEHECKMTASEIPLTLNTIAMETRSDPILTQAIECVQSGSWPSKPDSALARFRNLYASLSVYHRCLFMGNRVVIPQSQRSRVLKALHDGHPGSDRMKKLAKSYVYWHGLSKDIDDYVKQCEQCQKSAKSPVKAELCSWPKSTAPWSRVHIDYAGPINGKWLLIVVDSYSKWPEVIEMTTTTTNKTIESLAKVFAQFGNPEVLVSDNGTQFTSSEFKIFCEQNGIRHIRSPPFHPQSNGQAERFVDTLKRSLAKHESEGMTKALQKFLLTYRYTPCVASPENKSPAENFLGRPIRNRLTLLNSPIGKSNGVDIKMEKQFNTHHRAKKRTFAANELVWVKMYRGNKDFWEPGRIKSLQGKTTYEVEVLGQSHHRHANQLRNRADKELSKRTTSQPETHKAYDLRSRTDRQRQNAQAQKKALVRAARLSQELYSSI